MSSPGVYLDLVLNLTLLVALSIVSGFIEKRVPRHFRTGQLMQGLLFGATAVIGMMRPLTLMPGLIIDGRSVMISLCALFFGPLSIAVAATLTIAYRIFLGGSGAITGALVTLSSVAIGLLARYRSKPEQRPPSAVGLYLLGIIVHLAMLALLLFTLPGGAGLGTVKHIALPVMLLYPLAMILAGKILSDQVEAERVVGALQEADWKFQALFEKGPIGVAYHEMIYDKAGKAVDYRFLDANASYLELTGVDPREQTVREAFPGIENDPADWIGTFAEVVRTGEQKRFEQYLQFNGRWYDCVAYRYKLGQFVVAFNNITERKQAEQALAQSNAQLKSKNRELEQVVYVASHDLRSPLVNIDGYSKEMAYALDDLTGAFSVESTSVEDLKRVAATPLREMSESLGYIRKSAAQMDALLSGLLKLSRSGRAALTIVPLDMDKLTEQVVSAIEFQIKEAGVDLVVETLPPCMGDEVQVGQVFSNLLGNALKFLDQARPGKIRMSGAIEDGRAVYCVEDNGIGIAAAHQSNIFEVFHRLNPEKSTGEGLGLAIVRQVLGRLGGEVRVESKLGVGSRFYAILPAVREKVQNEGRTVHE